MVLNRRPAHDESTGSLAETKNIHGPCALTQHQTETTHAIVDPPYNGLPAVTWVGRDTLGIEAELRSTSCSILFILSLVYQYFLVIDAVHIKLEKSMQWKNIWKMFNMMSIIQKTNQFVRALFHKQDKYFECYNEALTTENTLVNDRVQNYIPLFLAKRPECTAFVGHSSSFCTGSVTCFIVIPHLFEFVSHEAKLLSTVYFK